MWSFKICTILSVYSWGRRHMPTNGSFKCQGVALINICILTMEPNVHPGGTGHIHSSIHSLTPAGDLGDMSFSIAVFFISFQLCWYPKRKRIPSWKHFPLNVSNFKTTENVKIHSLIQSKQVLKSWEVTGMRVKDDGPLMTRQHCEYFHWREVEGSSIFLWRQKDK